MDQACHWLGRRALDVLENQAWVLKVLLETHLFLSCLEQRLQSSNLMVKNSQDPLRNSKTRGATGDLQRVTKTNFGTVFPPLGEGRNKPWRPENALPERKSTQVMSQRKSMMRNPANIVMQTTKLANPSNMLHVTTMEMRLEVWRTARLNRCNPTNSSTGSGLWSSSPKGVMPIFTQGITCSSFTSFPQSRIAFSGTSMAKIHRGNSWRDTSPGHKSRCGPHKAFRCKSAALEIGNHDQVVGETVLEGQPNKPLCKLRRQPQHILTWYTLTRSTGQNSNSVHFQALSFHPTSFTKTLGDGKSIWLKIPVPTHVSRSWSMTQPVKCKGQKGFGSFLGTWVQLPFWVSVTDSPRDPKVTDESGSELKSGGLKHVIWPRSTKRSCGTRGHNSNPGVLSRFTANKTCCNWWPWNQVAITRSWTTEAMNKDISGLCSEVRFTDGQNVSMERADNTLFSKQSRRIANPNGPRAVRNMRIMGGPRLASFSNPATQNQNYNVNPRTKETKNCPAWHKSAGRCLGTLASATNPSLKAIFLSKDLGHAFHLLVKEGLHLFSLHVQLGHHLRLQRLHLIGTLNLMVLNGHFKVLLSCSQLLQLLFQSVDALVLNVSFHVLRLRRRNLGQDGLFQSFFHLCQLAFVIDLHGSRGRWSWGFGRAYQPRVSKLKWVNCSVCHAQLDRSGWSCNNRSQRLWVLNCGAFGYDHLAVLHTMNCTCRIRHCLYLPHEATRDCTIWLQRAGLPRPFLEDRSNGFSVQAIRPWSNLVDRPGARFQKQRIRFQSREGALKMSGQDTDAIPLAIPRNANTANFQLGFVDNFFERALRKPDNLVFHAGTIAFFIAWLKVDATHPAESQNSAFLALLVPQHHTIHSWLLRWSWFTCFRQKLTTENVKDNVRLVSISWVATFTRTSNFTARHKRWDRFHHGLDRMSCKFIPGHVHLVTVDGGSTTGNSQSRNWRSWLVSVQVDWLLTTLNQHARQQDGFLICTALGCKTNGLPRQLCRNITSHIEQQQCKALWGQDLTRLKEVLGFSKSSQSHANCQRTKMRHSNLVNFFVIAHTESARFQRDLVGIYLSRKSQRPKHRLFASLPFLNFTRRIRGLHLEFLRQNQLERWRNWLAAAFKDFQGEGPVTALCTTSLPMLCKISRARLADTVFGTEQSNQGRFSIDLSSSPHPRAGSRVSTLHKVHELLFGLLMTSPQILVSARQRLMQQHATDEIQGSCTTQIQAKGTSLTQEGERLST